MATIFTGGQGIVIDDLNNGTVVEVISDYKPPIYDEQGEGQWPEDIGEDGSAGQS